MKQSILIYFLFLSALTHSQTVVWQDDFEIPANWSLNIATGLNAVDANIWVISDAEGGMPAGSCGTATNGNRTLHIGCQGAWCAGTGATYNAGDGGLGFIDATTHKRSYTANNISTLNNQNLNLEFDYIGVGQPGADFGTIIYSVNGGSTWSTLQVINPASTCASGQGLWSHLMVPLPISCNNISTLKIGFEWVNDNDGNGSDPSLALNNLKITSPIQPSVSANFDFSGNDFCEGTCLSFMNTSVGATSYSWDFGNGLTATSQNPQAICFTSAGTYNVQLIACNGNLCDTVSSPVTIYPLYYGQYTISASGSYTWPSNGMTYTQSGTYTDTIQNPNDCDSINTLTLTILTGGISEAFLEDNKILLKIIDLTGREVERKRGQVLILYFDDNSIKKVFIQE